MPDIFEKQRGHSGVSKGRVGRSENRSVGLLDLREMRGIGGFGAERSDLNSMISCAADQHGEQPTAG